MLEIEKQQLEMQKMRLEFEKEHITFALEIGDMIIEKLYPDIDAQVKTRFIRDLLPNLMQLDTNKAIARVLSMLQNTQEETKEDN